MSRSSIIRFASRIGALLVVAGSTVLVGSPGATAQTQPDATQVVPVVECVFSNADGSYGAVFGYNNDRTTSVVIPIGTRNVVTISPAAPVTLLGGSQPSSFLVGRQGFGAPRGVFAVRFTDGQDVSWRITDSGTVSTATATVNTRSCAQSAIPTYAMSAPFAAAGLLAVGFAVRRRTRRESRRSSSPVAAA